MIHVRCVSHTGAIPTNVVLMAAWRDFVYCLDGEDRNALLFIAYVGQNRDKKFEKAITKKFSALVNPTIIGNKRKNAPDGIDEKTKILKYSGEVYKYTVGWDAFCDLFKSSQRKRAYSLKIA